MFPRLYYVWGHSYEFAGDNNWHILNKLCEKLSAHEDIWYAANIDIYEYVQAYNALVFSADGSMVYNPTIIKVWFLIDRVLYCILPGQTLNLK